jgi:hypothetical protein
MTAARMTAAWVTAIVWPSTCNLSAIQSETRCIRARSDSPPWGGGARIGKPGCEFRRMCRLNVGELAPAPMPVVAIAQRRMHTGVKRQRSRGLSRRKRRAGHGAISAPQRNAEPPCLLDGAIFERFVARKGRRARRRSCSMTDQGEARRHRNRVLSRGTGLPLYSPAVPLTVMSSRR